MASLFGLLGAILAVPAAALVQIVMDEFYLRPRNLDYAEIDREATVLVSGENGRRTPPAVSTTTPPNEPISEITTTH
jgi:hypothetical protein